MLSKQDLLNQFEVWNGQQITREAYDEFATLANKMFDKAVKMKDRVQPKVIWRETINVGDEHEPYIRTVNVIIKWVKLKDSETWGTFYISHEWVE
jgi:hypothetical protein